MLSQSPADAVYLIPELSSKFSSSSSPSPPAAELAFSLPLASSLTSSASPLDIYQTHLSSASDAPEQQSYLINSSYSTDIAPMTCYISQSPSPVEPHSSISVALPHPITVSHLQQRFLHSDVNPYPAEDRLIHHLHSGSDLPSNKQQHKYSSPTLQNSLYDQRRMSEPAILSPPALYSPSTADSSSARYNNFPFAYNAPPLLSARPTPSFYSPLLHRGASTGSLRDLRHHHLEYPPQQQEWKHDDSRHRHLQQNAFYEQRADPFDDPMSPMHSAFTHDMVGSPTSGLPYDNYYGPSPPGTGTSTSSSVAPLSAGLPSSPSRTLSQHLQRSMNSSHLSNDSIDRKTYSFVALPGNTVKKRPRRRYDEIERLYLCSWPDCNKSYGTLNHLNAHVTMQKHGPKRNPNEFKELRKQWRKAKKDQEAVAASMRREHYNDSYDERFSQRYLPNHSLQQRNSSRHSGLGLPSSVTIGTSERYSVPVDDIRYPPQERDDSSFLYGSVRQRCTNLQPASWHSTSDMSSRPMNQQTFSSSLPSQPSHHSQLPQLAIDTSIAHHSTNIEPESVSLNRLPQNSTLLTPLHGYPTTSIMPPISGGNITYTTVDGYVYDDDDDNNGRPGTGHASIASMEDFDQTQ